MPSLGNTSTCCSDVSQPSYEFIVRVLSFSVVQAHLRLVCLFSVYCSSTHFSFIRSRSVRKTNFSHRCATELPSKFRRNVLIILTPRNSNLDRTKRPFVTYAWSYNTHGHDRHYNRPRTMHDRARLKTP